LKAQRQFGSDCIDALAAPGDLTIAALFISRHKASRRADHAVSLFPSVCMRIETFTGGVFDTNCFLLPDHGILIDAPQDAAEWLARTGDKVALLLLTHGHIDHVVDAARIKQEHGCRVGYHRDSIPLLTDRSFFKQFGFGWEIEPVEADFLIAETERTEFAGVAFRVLEVPGHCPGSLCFFGLADRVLFGGDVLFAGGVGRWDLPGGDGDLLFAGIREKVLPLGDDVRVLPGHGPATTIGVERRTNPYLANGSD
jgi:glyoxylase-like metal-dependent hydrolase (beta-lactamase superfamily II)